MLVLLEYDWWQYLFICVGVLLMPWLLTRPWVHSINSFERTGQVGDTIGGLTAPFIGLLSAYLVYKAFQEQVNSNKLLSEQIKMERFDRLLSKLEENRSKFTQHVIKVREILVIPEIKRETYDEATKVAFKYLKDHPHDFKNEDLNKLVNFFEEGKAKKEVDQYDLMIQTKEFTYTIGLLIQANRAAMKASKEDSERFYDLYVTNYFLEIVILKEMLEKYASPTNEHFYTDMIIKDLKRLEFLNERFIQKTMAN